MYFIVYVSTASSLMSEEELADLLHKARLHNTGAGISGMLLYKDGSFMQLIEGDEADVKNLFWRIANDTRHSDVTTVIEGKLENRNFPDWSMGFKIVDKMKLAAIEGFQDLSQESFASAHYTQEPHIALKLLSSFNRNIK